MLGDIIFIFDDAKGEKDMTFFLSINELSYLLVNYHILQ
jgi:hypothetical protein